ncbi:hypothetical protein B0J15DRAFT_270734 [Fusarium solani]|jgi:hypothetical protein|uniref:Uncharacterized protein n=1 Tax=Fusarium solani TaxID=169388 RepID=A0A9P9HVA1_FUSSL|nr:uncharacterized protein B0J15DRAFT_270734 [Fusarium solani]KAH7264469.1 hypothetical protein B0J15DRAFT_270734 [Fusarium solani]
MNSISVAQLTVSRSTTNNDEALPRLRIPLAELAEHRQRKSGRKRSDKAAEAETPAAAAAVGALMRLDAPRSPAGPRSIVRISSSPSLSPGNSVDTDLGDPAQGSAPSDEPTKKQSRLTPSRVNGCWQLRAAPLRDPFHLPQKHRWPCLRQACVCWRGLSSILQESSTSSLSVLEPPSATYHCHPSYPIQPPSQNLRGRHPGQIRMTSALLSRAPRSSPGYPWNPLGPNSCPVPFLCYFLLTCLSFSYSSSFIAPNASIVIPA